MALRTNRQMMGHKMRYKTVMKVRKQICVNDMHKKHDSQRKCGMGGRLGAGTNISIFMTLGIFKELKSDHYKVVRAYSSLFI